MLCVNLECHPLQFGVSLHSLFREILEAIELLESMIERGIRPSGQYG